MSYNHTEIDQKWQKKWEEAHCFLADKKSQKPKYYALDMFPYPSGAGLHVGHLVSYTPTDIVARYKRAQGFNVLHPMGYDAFGLPAEQYAIQTGIHPAITTQKAIDNFRRQLKSFGYSFDWSREVSTCDPKYYKWTQFIFTKLFERGLAYQKEVPVNWCPALKTVLANEEVVDGKSERGGHPVVRMPMKQWMLKITDYAERLLKDLDKLDWPERTKDGQRNWIGKSEGAEIKFKTTTDEDLVVYTTRPDTIFGATFMVVAPEHPLCKKINQTTEIKNYITQALSKSEVSRKANEDKTGVFSGAYAINPFNNQKIPIWISDYVLMDYGTGAIMAVPAHDARDFEFAKKFNLEIKRVLEGGDLPFDGDGKLVNSDFLNSLEKASAIKKMIDEIVKRGLGKKQVQYKLRDWLFSRQRYWGEPFPVVHLSDGSIKTLSKDELPVVLPEVADYEPSEKGEAPLARNSNWVKYAGGKRETDTMPGSAGSSWYFLRYTDPKNENEAFSHDAQKYWMPVDLYVGGPEHTVGHLLYARFWQKVLFDVGLTSYDEPFKKLAHQGMLLGPDGEKMSKSRGNTIDPDEVRKNYGADAVRMYICFMGPFDKDKPWATTGIEGVRRFLERVWRLVFDDSGKVVAQDLPIPSEIEKLLHKTIKKVTEDIESMSFNTAISQMMILVNELYKLELKPRKVIKLLCQLMMPFAPHMSEEIWQALGEKGFVNLALWPSYNPELVKDDVITMGVQVNGKMRGTIEISPTATEAEALGLALNIVAVKNQIPSGKPDKIIYKQGKILNLIAKT
ncbi:MAG: leucine--tRNA ligase [Oligoflexia bacterium]|nr:leucine--tRNA ligase [Oligoflexia bacterium]